MRGAGQHAHTARHGTALHGTALHGTALHGAALGMAEQCMAEHCMALPARHCVARHCMAWCGALHGAARARRACGSTVKALSILSLASSSPGMPASTWAPNASPL
eukprot:5523631-Prymnesium_polylepis.1